MKEIKLFSALDVVLSLIVEELYKEVTSSLFLNHNISGLIVMNHTNDKKGAHC